ncbi:MAG TPA: C39 family peptidase [Elusimicrobiales bacterium]|nr:C39 family peptidase [Elusimicrobiales bacterium]
MANNTVLGGNSAGRWQSLRPLGAVLLFSLAACAGGSAPALPRNALPVPIVRQSSSYSCGSAALLAVLFYWQVYDGNESGLAQLTGTTPAAGTTPQGIIRGAQKFGLSASYRENVTAADLAAALARGETVIVDIQAWPDKPGELPWAKRREDGHYLVLTALDAKYAYFMDPSVGSGYTYIPLPELFERWHDYEELETGVWNNKQLAIFISGKTPLKKYPAALTPTL